MVHNFTPKIWAPKLFEETMLRQEMSNILSTITGGPGMSKVQRIPDNMDPAKIKFRLGETFEWKGHYISRLADKPNGYFVRLGTNYTRYPNLTIKQAIKTIEENQ